MKVNKAVDSGVMTLAVDGEINTLTAPLLAGEVADLSGISALVFDLENVRYVSSAGLRLFLRCQNTMEEAGGEMRIVNCSPFVTETFVSVGYNRIMRVEAKENP